jgi:hypothetical protein
MDFMNQLLEWNGMDAILVVVDQFSKLAKMALTNTVATSFDWIKLFFNMWVKHHEMPLIIVNDRDAKFTMGFLETFVLKGGNKIII